MKKPTKHNSSRIKTYLTWTNMKQRCLNKNHTFFRNYGGRGITVCDRWLKFENFLKDMGERPKGFTIDRINNEGNYTKENCRWSPQKQQAYNKRNTKYIKDTNDFNINILDFSEKYKIPITLVRSRIARGWLAEEIINKKFNERCLFYNPFLKEKDNIIKHKNLLTKKMQKVAELRLGITDNIEKKQNEVADIVGTTKQNICDMEKNILNRLKKYGVL